MIISKLPLAIAASALMFVTACDGTAPNGNQNAQQGAMIGAAAGAAAGLLTNRDRSNADRNRAALLTAVAGAGIGAAIGNNMDRQAEELRQSLGNGVGVTRQGDNLIVTLSQDILFATDSTAVSGASQNDLRIVAQSLNNYPNTTVNVVGHTDNTGDASYNFDLSQRRAQAVASVLRSGGVSSSRIRAIGAGEDQPIASNLNASGRAANRRVEIIITPN
ncbi:Outer membrane protein OmpA [Yoonia tamlensis]|uniref:Outer membrane protein OmpA n=1 Tax=Yoonia tamlensis TaxID=390270 RepID=A0A1I6GUC8_9RHOB|nr:OmpA family protein [Yoonia tamlensis]SFR45873.1 Outer membrane protein OmpA [Yoonia tamlensis]